MKRITEIVPLLISTIALVVSLFTVYHQIFYRNFRTYVVVNHAEFSYAEGKFGIGPKVTVVFSVINQGNRPTLVEYSRIQFGRNPDTDKEDFCDHASNEWTGLPPITYSDGKDNYISLSFTLQPGEIKVVASVYEPIHSEQSDIFNICLEIGSLDGSGNRNRVKIPIGRITVENSTIVEFAEHDKSSEMHTIIE